MNLIKKFTQILIFFSAANISCAKLLNRKTPGLEAALSSSVKADGVISQCDLSNKNLNLYTQYYEKLKNNFSLEDILNSQILPSKNSLLEKSVEKILKDKNLIEKAFYSNDKDTQELIAAQWYKTNKNLIFEYLFRNNLIENKTFKFQNIDFLLSLENIIIAASKNGVVLVLDENYQSLILDLRENLNHEEIINIKTFKNLILIYSNSRIILMDKEIKTYNAFTEIKNVELVTPENFIITIKNKCFISNSEQIKEIDYKYSNFNSQETKTTQKFEKPIELIENIFLNKPSTQLNNQFASKHDITLNNKEISSYNFYGKIKFYTKLSNANVVLSRDNSLTVLDIQNSIKTFLSQGTGLMNLKTISQAEQILQNFKTSRRV